MALKLVKDKNKSSVEEITRGLNPPQLEAVTHGKGPLLIIAGAGSGKTRALTHRIAYLLADGVEPGNLLALTFTNKAANEMKERIARLIGSERASSLWAGTFHSVFARILRFEAEALGYTSGFSIYDTDDSLRIVKSSMDSLNISMKDMPPQGMRNRISWAKNHNMSWQSYAENVSSALEEQTAKVFEAYEKTLKNNNAMDFDDLLLNFIKVLKLNPATLEKYQERFRYILVDEYQDTNRAQYIAVSLLGQKYRNVCVVGDDAQSIYRWRGAEIKNILDFKKEYPEAKIVRLEQNYRSTKTILNAAASVIVKNSNQIPKKLWTENPDGNRITVIKADSDSNEAEKIADGIENGVKKDYEYGDFAVLYRTNAQSLALEKSLRTKKIPYIVIGGISFYQRKEIKDALAYLRLLVNQSDSEALMRIVNEPPRGLGAVSLKHIRDFALEKKISLYDAFINAGEIHSLQPRAKNSAKKFIELIEKYLLVKDSMNPSELAMEYIEESGLLSMYKEIGTDEALDRWNNIQQLLSDISSFFKANNEQTLEDYLQQMTLITNIDESDISRGQVKLMTLHTAKGLEFPVVYISGIEHGLFPLARVESAPEEEEEERRLFYVGITRARERLYLCCARRRMRFGEYMPSAPSKFLSEVDPVYLEYEKQSRRKPPVQESSKKPSYKRAGGFFDDIPQKKDSYSQIPEPDMNFQIGDKVSHSKFGNGKIVALAGEGKNAKALVDFHGFGRKRLMLFYAKLVRI